MRSAVDNRCFVYGAAAQSHERKLIVTKKALRICVGAVKTTPTKAFLAH